MWYEGKLRIPLLQGPTIELGGQEFTIAATPNALKKVVQHALAGRAALQQHDTDAAFGGMLESVAALLKANYIEITPELLGENVGIVELVEKLVEAVQTVMAEATEAGERASAPPPTLANRLTRRAARALH